MIQILFDIDMPKSCVECPFMVHCDSCESWENRCPILGKKIGYDYNEPYTPRDHRQENCPLKEVEERPHGEWITKKEEMETFCSVCDEPLPYTDEYDYETNFCPNCGADMREGDSDD